jgi:hypothetical protein
MRSLRQGIGLFCALSLSLGGAACTGDIGAIGGTGSPTGSTPTGSPAGGSGGAGISGGAGVSGGAGSTGPAGTNGAAGQPVDPGTVGLHRLNSNEYNATVADVLGTKLQPASTAWRGGEIGGFDNIAAVLDVDEAQVQRYFDTAGLIADDVFASPTLKAKIVTCATTDATCVQGIIGATGKRLFRRPLATEEITTFNKVYTAARGLGETHEGSIKQVLRALLTSPDFVYRVEIDPTPTSTAAHPLTAYELASRLSYFLWSSAPDDAMLTAAGDGTLLKDDTIRATIDRMLADPVKSQRFVENFSGQWLGARKLPAHAVDAPTFPDWSSPLAASLTQEMYLYFAEFVRNDRPWTEFMKADLNFVDANSAKLYGVTAGAGPAGSPAKMTIATDQRKGFAGLGGFLALSSMPKRTSPTQRGRWMLANLLCQEPPPPPDGVVPDLAVGGLDPTKNVRVALEEHRKVMTCAVCHSAFDPFGMALEKFDGIGKYRTTYNDGTAIDDSAVLKGKTFAGIDGMADIVTTDPRFQTCVAKELMIYGLGRLATPNDQPFLDAINTQWTSGALTLRRLIQSVVLQDSFRTRHGAAN